LTRDSRKTLAFWDSSALVPLCVQQTNSSRAGAEFRTFSPVVWWGTRVEIQSAIYRLYREKAISGAAKIHAVSRLASLISSWREILPADEVRMAALEILEKYPLRAADTWQLAASLIWCDQHPARRTFISADRRLATAARSVGFTVVELT